MSIVNKYFTRTDEGWKCKLCPAERPTFYKISASASTTTRKKHLHQVHNIEASTPDPPQKKFKMNFFPQTSGSNELNEKIVELFAEFGMPFHAIEAHTFTSIIQLSNKNIKVSFSNLILSNTCSFSFLLVMKYPKNGFLW